MPAKKPAAANAAPAAPADSSEPTATPGSTTETETAASSSTAPPADQAADAPTADAATGSGNPPVSPAPVVSSEAPAEPAGSGENSPTGPFTAFLDSLSRPVAEIPTPVPVVAPVVVDAIAAVPDQHRAAYQQLIRSLAAVNHGLNNAAEALQALRTLCQDDSGRELLVARGINAFTVQGRLRHILSTEPEAEADGF